MFTHNQVWTLIDTLAKKKGLSVSKLARISGLDPTSFNRSKRITAAGRKRWPSTESLSKILNATNSSVIDFLSLEDKIAGIEVKSLPIIGMDLLKKNQPIRMLLQLLESVATPQKFLIDCFDQCGYGVELSDNTYLPFYKSGDIVIVAANSGYSIGSRVVVQTHQNETVIGELKRSQSSYIEVLAFKKPCPLLSIKRKEIEYIAPIWGCAYRHLGRIIEDSKP